MSFWQVTFLIESAHQQQVSSKAYVNRDPCAAQGTPLATIPHSGHDTLKVSLRTYAFMPPTTQHLQSRIPRPASYRGASLPHLPHLQHRALHGSAPMARAPAPSIAMPRTLILSTPTMLFANLLTCTPPPLLRTYDSQPQILSGKRRATCYFIGIPPTHSAEEPSFLIHKVALNIVRGVRPICDKLLYQDSSERVSIAPVTEGRIRQT